MSTLDESRHSLILDDKGDRMWSGWGYRVLIAGMLVLVVSLAANAVSLKVRQSTANAQLRARADRFKAPFTVVSHERIFNANLPPEGKVTTGVYITAVRRDGSWMYWAESRNDGLGAFSSRRKIYLSSGLFIETDEPRRIRSTLQLPSPRFRDRREPESQCRFVMRDGSIDKSEEFLGEAMVVGIKTVMLKGRGNTAWVAPELNCAELRYRTVFPGGALNEQTAVDVIPGEPDSRLFSADGYEEVASPVLLNLSPGSLEAQASEKYYREHRPIR